MDKFQCCIVIKFLSLKRSAPPTLHTDVVAALEDDVHLFVTVKKWSAKFKRERESLDDMKSGLPTAVTTEGNSIMDN